MKHMIIFLILLLTTACTTANASEPVPPTIYYGESVCEFCGMIISEARYAAGYISADGAEHVFDDIGDMIKAHQQQQEKVSAFFVHDYNDERWIRAESAFYVLSPHLNTPMGSGLAAVAVEADAGALAAKVNGQVLSFADLLVRFESEPAMAGHEPAIVH